MTLSSNSRLVLRALAGLAFASLAVVACTMATIDDRSSASTTAASGSDGFQLHQTPETVDSAPAPNRYVLTQHNNNQRTGAYLGETTLNYANVQQEGMTVKLHLPVDSNIQVQALYKPADSISASNTVYTATMNNTVYAFDANAGTQLWSTHLVDPTDGASCASYVQSHAVDAGHEYDYINSADNLPMDPCAIASKCRARGITSTPVIDLAKGYMYVVYGTQNTTLSSAPVSWSPPPSVLLPGRSVWNDSAGDGVGLGPGTYAQMWACRNNWVNGTNSSTQPACPTFCPADGPLAGNAVAFYLAALDLHNHGNVVATQPIAGASGSIQFNPMAQYNRPGLLLSNNHVYVGFSASSEYALVYHGWVFSFGTTNLPSSFTPAAAPFVTGDTSYNDEGAGVWQAGGGLVSDPSGNVYFATGNGTNANTVNGPNAPVLGAGTNSPDVDVNNHGNSILQLGPGLNLIGTFQPTYSPEHVGTNGALNYSYWLDWADLDLGGGGTMFINENGGALQSLLGGGKTGVFYLLNPNASNGVLSVMAGQGAGSGGYANDGFRAFNDGWAWQARGTNMEYFGNGYAPHLHGAPVYWHSSDGNGRIYAWAEKDTLKSFTYYTSGSNAGTMSTSPTATGDVLADPVLMPGGMLSLSANGSTGGSDVLWATLPINCNGQTSNSGRCGMLLAYDAFTLTRLFSTKLTTASGTPLQSPQWAPPTIADGQVFVGTQGAAPELQVFGLGTPSGSTFAPEANWSGQYGNNGNPQSTFSPQLVNFCVGSQTCKLADVNGDGLADLVAFSNDATGAVWVALSNGWSFGNGQPADGGPPNALWVNSGVCTTGEQCEMGDVNGDGKADIVVFTKGSSNLAVAYLSNGTSFTTTQQLLNGYFCLAGESCHVADVNGDGRADIIDFQNGFNGNTGIWVDLAGIAPAAYAGTNGFPPAQLWDAGFCTAGQKCALGNVDGVNGADAIAFSSTGATVALSNGSNGFGAAGPLASGIDCVSNLCSVADVTGDQKADVIEALDGAIMYVFPSTGSSFGASSFWGNADGVSEEILVADVNGDHLGDLVQLEQGPQYVSVATP
jgi:hypothetical protein